MPAEKPHARSLTDSEQQEALRLLALGTSRYKVAQRLGVHFMAVVRLAEQAEHRGILKPLKDRMRGKLGVLLERDLDFRMESSEAMTPIEFGVLFDKHALLSGDPTEIVEVKDESADRIRQALERLRAGEEANAIVAEVIEPYSKRLVPQEQVPQEFTEAVEVTADQREVGRPRGARDTVPIRRPKGDHRPRFRRQTP